MKTLKNMKILILVIASIFSINSCNKDECKGEPIYCSYDLKLNVKFINEEGNSIFNTDYNIDSLTIYENTTERTFDFLNDSSIEFTLNTTSFDFLKKNINKNITNVVIYKFDNSEKDTLFINSKFVEDTDNPCRDYYFEYVKITYNSTTLIDRTNVQYILSKNDYPLILKKY